MRYLKILFSLLLLQAVLVEAGQEILVQTQSGPILGKSRDGVSVFLGIPFAQPPVGSWRWKPPQPVVPWTAVKETQEFKSNCLQESLFTPGILVEGDEDCLYLNVWTSNLRPIKKLPVMVFIHGGAYVMGGANQIGAGQTPYEGENLSRNQSVVVVTLNYRLGLLGFLSHPKLKKEDRDGSVGNYGLMDALAALKWVQANIEKFGGDKNNVFVFGESAGAMLTGALVASPAARGLFAKAGLQSGFYEALRAEERYPEGLDLEKKFKCNDLSDSMKCLREQSGESITRAQTSLIDMRNPDVDPKTYYKLLSGPVIDGALLPRSPIQQVRAGRHNRVPMIIGSNLDETDLFTTPESTLTCWQYENAVKSGAGVQAEDLLRIYPCKFLNPRGVATKLTSAIYFHCPTRRWAQAASRYSHIYRYLFSYQAIGLLGIAGATHFVEVPFVFGNLLSLANAPTPSALELSKQMQDRWGQFAWASVPTQNDSWPAFDAGLDQILEFDSQISSIRNFEKTGCDYLDLLVIQ